MGIQAMQPWNITYSVLGPSIGFILGGEGEGGRDSLAHSGAALTFPWNLPWKKEKTNALQQSTSTQPCSKLPASLQAGCPTSSLIAVCVILIYRDVLEAGTCQSELRAIRQTKPFPSPKDQHMASGNYRVRLIAPSWHGRSVMSPGFSTLTPNPVMPAQSNFPSILPHGRKPHWAAVCKRHLVPFLACALILHCMLQSYKGVCCAVQASACPSRELVVTHRPQPSEAMFCLTGN